AFWHGTAPGKPYNETIVWLCTENKGIAGTQARTKVTICFGPASANINPDCVITMTSMNSIKSETRGK
ncbi:MAG: hypothetical protein WB799_14110, partial [Candidatus Sulfotelmatobacter sp.]